MCYGPIRDCHLAWSMVKRPSQPASWAPRVRQLSHFHLSSTRLHPKPFDQCARASRDHNAPRLTSTVHLSLSFFLNHRAQIFSSVRSLPARSNGHARVLFHPLSDRATWRDRSRPFPSLRSNGRALNPNLPTAVATWPFLRAPIRIKRLSAVVFRHSRTSCEAPPITTSGGPHHDIPLLF